MEKKAVSGIGGAVYGDCIHTDLLACFTAVDGRQG